MKRYAPNLILALIFLAAWQFMLGRQADLPKTKPAPAAAKAVNIALPAGLHLDSTFAREHFQTAISKVVQADSSPEAERNKIYGEATAELDKIASAKDPEVTLADQITASLEKTDLLWHKMTQREQAATEVDGLIQVNLAKAPADLLVSVHSAHAAAITRGWTQVSAHAYAASLYHDVVQAIHDHNKGQFGYETIHTFVRLFIWAGSYRDALALILLGIVVSVLLTPVRNWQFRSMMRMGKLQPELRKIQQQYKGQQEEIGRRTMELYKEQGVNPMSGCLPALVQLPFMWWLYAAIRQYQFELNGKFLWVGSHFAETHTGWTLPKGPIFATSLAHIDVPLLIVYTASMYVYSKMMPMTATDPAQLKQSQNMSAMMSLTMPFMFYFYGWPSAFTLWWLAMNVAQILITVFYLRRHPALKALFNPSADNTSRVQSVGAAVKPSARRNPATENGARSMSPENRQSAAATSGTDGSNAGANGRSANGASNGANPGPAKIRRIEPRNRRKPRGRRI